MRNPFLVVDFDFTLVNTSFLDLYRSNPKGIEFAVNNMDKIKTEEYSPLLKDICNDFHRRGKIAIVSDAPREHVELLIAKHGFPKMPVYGSCDKPSTYALYDILRRNGIRKEEILVIGDSPKDILMAHEFNSASVGVTWSESKNPTHKDYLEKRLRRAQPNSIIDKFSSLGEEIERFAQENFGYTQFVFPEDYLFFDFEPGYDMSLEAISLGEYKPKSYTEHEKRIFDFKDAKEAYYSDITKGAVMRYFWEGSIKGSRTYYSVFRAFLNSARAKLASMNLQGTTSIIAAPNSLPNYCYKSDINNIFAAFLANPEAKALEKRLTARLKPKKESHKGASRSIIDHLNTIGFYNNPETISSDNIVIFDDVRTSGSQLNSIAYGLRRMNFAGNIYALTLGHVKDNNAIEIELQ